MRNEYFFRVAGLTFSVILPGGLDAETLLPSFRPFRCGECPEGERISGCLPTPVPLRMTGNARSCWTSRPTTWGMYAFCAFPAVTGRR